MFASGIPDRASPDVAPRGGGERYDFSQFPLLLNVRFRFRPRLEHINQFAVFQYVALASVTVAEMTLKPLLQKFI